MADYQAQIDIERLLFETGAIRVAPENKPFWYTSGTIGPYYSNTQNLIGSEADANGLLELIDSALGADRLMLPALIERRVSEAYENNACYRTVAGYITQCVGENIDIGEIDYISGGERRDWFFSYMAARIFNKPHITIFKDLSMAVSRPGEADVVNNGSCGREEGGLHDFAKGCTSGGINSVSGAARPGAAIPIEWDACAGKRCLHVSDIITEASSYARMWSPAIKKAGMTISASLTILDRLQGGGAVLASLGIKHISLAKLDAPFFDRAFAQGHINKRQHALLQEYISDPNAAMRAFLRQRPEFIRDALAAGGKEAERARMCIGSGVYGISTQTED